MATHGGSESGAEGAQQLAEQERTLAAQLAGLRERRRAAQRDIAQAGALRLAIERVARDRSSGTTEEIERTRDLSQQLFDELSDLVGEADYKRMLHNRLREAYPGVTVPPRLSAVFAEEAAWRTTINADDRAARFRLHLPAAGEVL